MNMIDSAQKFITTTIVSALLASLPLSALGDWKLVPSESDIAFATIKNSAVVESHTFERFSGEVMLSGAANIRVDLASVETRIPIRNERMGTLLFNINQFPSLDISSKYGGGCLNSPRSACNDQFAWYRGQYTVTAGCDSALFKAISSCYNQAGHCLCESVWAYKRRGSTAIDRTTGNDHPRGTGNILFDLRAGRLIKRVLGRIQPR